VSWRKERDAWLAGRIQPEVSYRDVARWLESEELFHPYIARGSGGSHQFILRIPGVSSKVPGIHAQDTFAVPVSGGNACKGMYVRKLVEIYEYLKQANLITEEQSEEDEENGDE
jgi:hypothetical protein